MLRGWSSLRLVFAHPQHLQLSPTTTISSSVSPRITVEFDYPEMEEPPPAKLPQATDAQYPFHQRSADIILRSHDLVDFHVHTIILAQASPFFASMFELPQPVDSKSSADIELTRSTTPVVDMAEDAETLDLFLRLLYPTGKPVMKEARLLTAVLKTALKYDMTWLVDFVSERMLAVTPHEALQVWAAACSVGLENVARRAAEILQGVTPRSPLSDLGPDEKVLKYLQSMESEEHARSPYVVPVVPGIPSIVEVGAAALKNLECLGEMAGITAGDYFRLKRFVQIDQSHVSQRPFALLEPDRGATEADTVGDPHSRPASFLTVIPFTDAACRPSLLPGESSSTSFLAHQSVLSLHSSVLANRIAALRCPTDRSDMTPPVAQVVLNFDEGAEVVAALLNVCYHGNVDIPSDLTTLAELLVAAQKYEMAQVSHWCRLAWEEAAARHPLDAYFVAIINRLPELAKSSAMKLALERPVADVYVAIMERAPALAYHRLLLYYDSCCRVARESLEIYRTRIPSRVDWSSIGSYDTGAVKTCLTSLTDCRGQGLTESWKRQNIRHVQEQAVSLLDSLDAWQPSRSKSARESPTQLVRTYVRTLFDLSNIPEELESAVRDVKIELSISESPDAASRD